MNKEQRSKRILKALEAGQMVTEGKKAFARGISKSLGFVAGAAAGGMAGYKIGDNSVERKGMFGLGNLKAMQNAELGAKIGAIGGGLTGAAVAGAASDKVMNKIIQGQIKRGQAKITKWSADKSADSKEKITRMRAKIEKWNSELYENADVEITDVIQCYRLNESFVGSLKGVSAGIVAAVTSMVGGTLVFMGGNHVAGAILFSSAALAPAIGHAVKKQAEFKILMKLDEQLATNVATRDNLFKTYASASAAGLVDERQYKKQVEQLTRQQKLLGERMHKHIKSAHEVFANSMTNDALEKMMAFIDAARDGALTSVEELAKYRVKF